MRLIILDILLMLCVATGLLGVGYSYGHRQGKDASFQADERGNGKGWISYYDVSDKGSYWQNKYYKERGIK